MNHGWKKLVQGRKKAISSFQLAWNQRSSSLSLSLPIRSSMLFKSLIFALLFLPLIQRVDEEKRKVFMLVIRHDVRIQ